MVGGTVAILNSCSAYPNCYKVCFSSAPLQGRASLLLYVGNVRSVHRREAVRQPPATKLVMGRTTVHYADNESNNMLKRLNNKLCPAGAPAQRVEYIVDGQPGNTYVLNSLTGVLATCPQTSVCNGAQALELAPQADRLCGGRNASILGDHSDSDSG